MTTADVAALPLTFRAEQARFVLDCVARSESCALVGLASVGKSNLVAFLRRDDVLRHYLDRLADQQVVIVVDGHSLAPEGPAAWQVFELTLHRLIQWLDHQPEADARSRQYTSEYASMVAARDALLGLRILDRVLDYVIDELGRRVTVLFDEFDGIAHMCPPGVFRNLRNLRDSHKLALTFVTFSRDHPVRLRADPLEMEPFYELLAHNVGGLTPYRAADADGMLQRLAARGGRPLADATAQALVAQSGGHAGLLRGLYHNVPAGSGAPSAGLESPHVWAECETIWRGLAEDEQQALESVVVPARSSHPDPTAEALLRLKGALVDDAAGRPRPFSPVFAEFVARRSAHDGEGLVLDRRTDESWYDGRLLSLSPLEQCLLFKLAEDPGAVYSRQQLLETMYPGEDFAPPANTDNRLDTLLSRLRKEIGDADPPRVLVTVRGRGIRLVARPT